MPETTLSRSGYGADEQVGRLKPAAQLHAPDEAVDEADVVGHAQRLGVRREPLAIRLTLGRGNGRVGRADDHVQGVGVCADDLGHRLDDRLEPLVGVEQPEAQDDLAALQAQPGLDLSASASGRCGTPCGTTSTRPASTP